MSTVPNSLTTALSIIALLEEVEPSIQAAAIGIVNLWKSNGASVPVILAGEVTTLDVIIAKARAEEGLPAVAPVADPDPAPPPATATS